METMEAGPTEVSSGSAPDDPPPPERKESDLNLHWHRVFVPIAVFIAGFGVFNWAELPLGWKDRTEQITRYLNNTVGWGSEWVDPVLWTQKSIELVLGIIAVVALVRRDVRWLVASLVGWLGVWTVMSFVDVWAEDRAELQEHTVYFVVFTLLLAIVFVVSLADNVARRLWHPERHQAQPEHHQAQPERDQAQPVEPSGVRS